MKDLIKQLSGLFGTGIAAACCLGLPLVLSTVGAIGLGFIINDAYLLPLLSAFIFFTLWQLHGTATKHQNMKPFWLSAVSGVMSIGLMFFLVTGIYPLPIALGLSLLGLMTGSLWDFIYARNNSDCAIACEAPIDEPNQSRRKINGAALAVASAGVFYGMYQSVEAFAPKAGKNDIKCWGANSCKGTTACGTAFNSCTGQNSCKGKGWLNMPEKMCYLKGGELLSGSEGDPAK